MTGLPKDFDPQHLASPDEDVQKKAWLEIAFAALGMPAEAPPKRKRDEGLDK